LIAGSALICTGCFVLFWYLALSSPIAEDSLVRVTLSPERVELHEARRSIEIAIYHSGKRYWLSSRLWHDRYDRGRLLSSLQGVAAMEVWLAERSAVKILGVHTDAVDIPPSIGVRLYQQNRVIGLGLAMCFLVGGLAAIVYSRRP
jgi:hypothetical protein